MSQVRSSIRTIAIIAAVVTALVAVTTGAVPTASALSAPSAPGAASTASAAPMAWSEILAIIGGEDQDVVEYPFMATVRTPNSFCGGTLIAPDWVLTAAHCVPPTNAPEDIRVSLGVTDTAERTGTTYQAGRIIQHPDADIALIELNESASEFRPIALATPSMEAQWEFVDSGWALGWGLVQAQGGVTRTLQGAALDLLPDSACTYWVGDDDPGIVCAGGDGTGVCMGDSGGPLLLDADGISTQIGVTSYGSYCGSAAGFVQIAHYHDWITETLGNDYGISAQVETVCAENEAVSTIKLANDTPYSKTVTVRVEGSEDSVVSIPPQGTAFEEISGRPNGSFLAKVVVDGRVVAEAADDVNCDFAAKLSYRCLGGDGAFDAQITNSDDVAATFAFVVDTITKTAKLDPGESKRLTITGRPDGYHKVKLVRDGVVTKQETIAVDCDPPEPEVSVKSSCLAGMGRIDVFLDNPTDQTQTYSVSVGRLAERVSSLAVDERSRVTVTGRPDGKLAVLVERGDGNLTIRNVEVSCAPEPSDAVTIAQSCLAGNGRIDVTLANLGDTSAEFGVTVGDLAARVRQIEAAMTSRVTVTGRPDGPISVVVTQDGTEIYTDDVEVGCDS